MVVTDKLFAGSIPQMYERYLVPLIFEPYALDLAAHVSTIALVEGKDAEKTLVFGRLRVRRHELAREAGMTEIVEVHSQEGELRGHVAGAKALAELDAVEDLDVPREADVLGAEVAVSLADSPFRDPELEKKPVCAQRLTAVVPQAPPLQWPRSLDISNALAFSLVHRTFLGA